MSDRQREGGLATVYAVWWIFLCLTIGWLAMLAAAITSRQHHLEGAADLVALSAAARLERGGDACDVARAVAQTNEVDLTSCLVEGHDVVVSVADEMALPLGVDGTMVATVRAGP